MDSKAENNINFPKFNLEKQENPLKLYLSSIFEELTSRKLLRKKSEIYLKEELFKEFFKLPSLLSIGIFKYLDKNNSKKISKEIFVEGMLNILTTSKENSLKILFKLCDFDNDGYIFLDDLNLLYFYSYNFNSKTTNNNYSENIFKRKEFHFRDFDYDSRIDEQTFEQLFKNNNKIFLLYILILNEIPITQNSLDLLVNAENLYKNYKSVNKNFCQDDILKYQFNHIHNLNYSPLDITFKQEEKNILLEKYISVNERNSLKKNTHCMSKNNKNIELNSDLVSTDTSPLFIELTALQNFSRSQLKKHPFTTIKQGFERFSHINFLNKYCNNQEKKISPEKKINSYVSLVDHIDTHSKNSCHGFIYKKTKSNKLKKFWVVLLNRDLFYFNSKKFKYKGLHNLSSSYYYEYISDSPFKNTFAFRIDFKNKKRTYFCDTLKEVQKWLYSLEKVIQIRKFSDGYEIGKLLDEGEFYEVRMAHNFQRKTSYKVKIIDKILLNASELDKVRNEIEVLSICQNDNIIKFFEVIESSDKIYMVSEYIQGTTLNNFLETSIMNMNEEQLKKFIFKIAQSLKYLSEIGIVIRNLKPENIIVTLNLDIKIIDVGTSKILGKGEHTNEFLRNYLFEAPEILAGFNYTKEVDIWSFGVIIFYLLTNELPYSDQIFPLCLLEDEIQFNSIFDNIKFKQLSLSAQDIIKKCLTKQSARINISGIISHSWFEK